MPNTDSKKKCCKAHDAGFAGPHCNNPVPSPTKEVESWEDLYPLDTFSGETKRELIEFIKSLLSQSRKEERERVGQIFLDAYFERKSERVYELYKVFKAKLNKLK